MMTFFYHLLKTTRKTQFYETYVTYEQKDYTF